MSSTRKEQTFEEALSALERIVAEMEEGELGLEACLARFEKGTRLAKFCTAKLGEAEKKIEVLMQKADGNAEWKELDEAEP